MKVTSLAFLILLCGSQLVGAEEVGTGVHQNANIGSRSLRDGEGANELAAMILAAASSAAVDEGLSDVGAAMLGMAQSAYAQAEHNRQAARDYESVAQVSLSRTGEVGSGHLEDGDDSLADDDENLQAAVTEIRTAGHEAAGPSEEAQALVSREVQVILSSVREQLRDSSSEYGESQPSEFFPASEVHESTHTEATYDSEARVPAGETSWTMPEQDQRRFLAGKTVLLSGEPIGVRGQNIFDTIHEAYQRKREIQTFIEEE